MKYAMVLLNNVIDIVEADTPPEWGPDPQGYPVIAVMCDETVTVDMMYNENTGEFSDYIQPRYIPTQLDMVESKIAMQESKQLAIMEAMAAQYEESLQNRIEDMEVQATIYETLLEMGGN